MIKIPFKACKLHNQTIYDTFRSNVEYSSLPRVEKPTQESASTIKYPWQQKETKRDKQSDESHATPWHKGHFPRPLMGHSSAHQHRDSATSSAI